VTGPPRDERLWLEFCARELELRRKLNEIVSDPPSSEYRATLREWWSSIRNIMAFLTREVAEFGTPRWIMPAQVLKTLEGLSGYLAVGKIPDPIKHAAVEGNAPPGPSERRDIGLAIAYCRAARGGIEHCGEVIKVADKTPVKTVMIAFGVSRTTVQGWNARERPAFLGVNPVTGEVLISLMQNAGTRYRAAGRSKTATERRESKRSPRNPASSPGGVS
jgi:hypothetical protein